MRDPAKPFGVVVGFVVLLFAVIGFFLTVPKKPPPAPLPPPTVFETKPPSVDVLCQQYAEAYLKKYLVKQEIKKLEDEQSTLIAQAIGKLSDEEVYKLLDELAEDREARRVKQDAGD